ncbi:MAG: Asp-tRNA(Asn)/Glu-tRNA(Gln) amidotransferase subunit GatA [Acidilobaceae archaeon]
MQTITEAWRLVADIREGVVDPVEHLHEVYERITRWEPRVNAYISIDNLELALEKAEEIAGRAKRGERLGKLAGLVVAVKDNISTTDFPTTAASRILTFYVPPFDATAVRKIREEDAIILGKTNLDEFAMGSTTELSFFGATRNPWDLERTPGGSSGGSAAALAYGGCDLALGTDTGGSARLPAAYTATFGLKPTYGLVSRYGVIPYGNSLEQVSPMARSSRDLALLLDVISGWDPLDSTTLKRRAEPLVEPIDARRLRVCAVRELWENADEPLQKAYWMVLKKLESEGATVEEKSEPSLARALPAYYTIAFAEAASNLARYTGVLYPLKTEKNTWESFIASTRSKGFGLEVKRRIMMGVYVLSEGYREEYYVAATKLRRLVRDALIRLTSECVIASQVSPVLPPRLGERIEDPLKLYSMDVYTVIANLSGLPALAQPVGFHQGLPVGVQWIGGFLEDFKLLSLGALVEELTGVRGVVASES